MAGGRGDILAVALAHRFELAAVSMRGGPADASHIAPAIPAPAAVAQIGRARLPDVGLEAAATVERAGVACAAVTMSGQVRLVAVGEHGAL